MEFAPGILCKIFEFVGGDDIAHCRAVCKGWLETIQGTELWRKAYGRDFGSDFVESFGDEDVSWAKEYGDEWSWRFGSISCEMRMGSGSSFDTDGRRVATFEKVGKGTVVVWDVDTGRRVRKLNVVKDTGLELEVVKLCGDKLVVGHHELEFFNFGELTVEVWNLHTGKKERSANVNVESLRHVACDGRNVVGSETHGAFAYDVETLAFKEFPIDHLRAQGFCAFSGDRVVFKRASGAFTVVDIATDEGFVKDLTSIPDDGDTMDLHKTKLAVVTATDTVELWDVETECMVHRATFPEAIDDLQYVNDRRLVCTLGDHIAFLDPLSGECVRVARECGRPSMYQVAGNRIVCQTEDTIEVWRIGPAKRS